MPDLSQHIIWSDWNDEDIYGIGGDMPVMTCLYMGTHPNVHANYFLVYTGPYLSQIGSDQKDEGIYGIWGTCQTFLSRLLI